MEAIKKTALISSGLSNSIIAFVGSIIGALVFSEINPFPFPEANDVATAIASKQLLTIAMALFTFVYAIRNMIKNYTFGKIKRVLNSANVWTMLASAITAIFGYFNINFPEDQAISVIEAVAQGNTELVLIGVYNFVNAIWHLIKKPVPVEQATA